MQSGCKRLLFGFENFARHLTKGQFFEQTVFVKKVLQALKTGKKLFGKRATQMPAWPTFWSMRSNTEANRRGPVNVALTEKSQKVNTGIARSSRMKIFIKDLSKESEAFAWLALLAPNDLFSLKWISQLLTVSDSDTQSYRALDLDAIRLESFGRVSGQSRLPS